eukprot:TRINITY_DN48375_c0_g1_i1.p1 TRINITY_DN48375_c0_g1~~TRINITY_DN48375_c0_g1_i1.p1  ORF type:complete len:371 (+),score=40.50 TRINITY_DN48375_c0_g1_i1:88-1113(+)
MAFYSYFWWEGPQNSAMNVAAVKTASLMLHRSIQHRRCDSADLPLHAFFAAQCHLRWRHLLMVSAELARYIVVNLKDVALGAHATRDAATFLQQARQVPFFRRHEGLGSPWLQLIRGHDTSFNEDFFPQISYGPVWPSNVVPLASFLEAHHSEFLADLQAILEADDKRFEELHRSNKNAGSHYREFGPREDDWQTLYFIRGKTWNEGACRAAPRTCELLRSRPELTACSLGNSGAGFLRLRPGGRIKPHFGVAPRLSAHLGLIVPDLGEMYMSVGGQFVRWETGRAVVFDDTFVHSVQHDGNEPRYVLNAWFCHPCDSEHGLLNEADLPSYCALPAGWGTA